MLESLKGLLKTVELKCTICGAKIQEGDSFTVNLKLSSEKRCLLVHWIKLSLKQLKVYHALFASLKK